MIEGQKNWKLITEMLNKNTLRIRFCRKKIASCNSKSDAEKYISAIKQLTAMSRRLYIEELKLGGPYSKR